MKKKIRNLFAGAAALFLAGFSHNVAATHFQASELTYTCVAPGLYSVNLKLYRDCSGSTAPSTAVLNLRPQGCGTTRTVQMTKSSGSNTIGNFYCPQLGAPQCTSAGQPNFEFVSFSATVTFTAAERNCPDWNLSWSECCRPSSANLVGQDDPYSEAYLNLAAGINNNSPIFGGALIPFVNKDMPIIMSSYANDPDGDSLVYSLKEPMNSASTFVPYQSYQQVTILNPNTSQYATAPAGSFSAAFPLHSYAVNWSQPSPSAVKNFLFDTQTGSMSFTPTNYVPNTPSAQGANKYVMVVQVDEYRKINGVPVKVGYVRRDMFVTLMDCGPNQNPKVTAPTANGVTLTPGTIINLRPGTPMNFQFTTADGNPNDVLTFSSDIASVLLGATFTPSTTGQPGGTIAWTPTVNHVRDQVYYFHITVEDDACPVKGHQTQTFGVRVSNTGAVTGTKEELSKSLTFVAYPNPYTETVSFKVQANATVNQEIVIYNSLGQQVDRIMLKNIASGQKQVVWEKGSRMAKGQYVARLLSGNQVVQSIQFTKL
ncbi:T9SS type A sorting domain-containing protein [Adhaeribacter soli]|uniref:T9SS type A sorting domain-containing protein n=1 Tax=Adhaeribacter soli TaxID=2607655 RepID=A0A5N1J5X0_9BACT|nr:T9SS type A sorting domain-containing protein [Adhaeribacter soli]KAA9340567.1 T9SS type A sorting domain-containing protein [Adhaeribacter soli]